MSEEVIVPFDKNLLRLPSCLAIHKQLRSNLNQFTPNDYSEFIQKLCQTNQSRICGIIRKNQSEIEHSRIKSVLLLLNFFFYLLIFVLSHRSTRTIGSFDGKTQ